MDDKLKSGLFPLLSTPENVLKKIIKSMELLDLNEFSLVSKKTESLAEMKSVQFPLLSTPKNALNEILKSLDMYYLVNFSLLSKKTNSLAEALNFKPMPIDIEVTHDMVAYADNVIPVFSIPNKPVVLEPQKPGCKPKILGKEFLEHALIYFKQKTVRALIVGENLDETFLPSVFYCVPYCENVAIHGNVSESAQSKILSRYQNAAKQLSLYSDPPAELKANMVAQNLDRLKGQYHTNRWMELEALLMANSAALGVFNMDLRTLNKFLKVWVRKKCNRRLEYLWSDIMHDDFDIKTVLAGIDYKEVPSDTIRTFKHSKKVLDFDWLIMTDTMEVRGGCDFRRRDGTRATLAVRVVNGIRKLEFFVWSHV